LKHDDFVQEQDHERRPAASAGPLWVSGEYANAPKALALKNTTETGPAEKYN